MVGTHCLKITNKIEKEPPFNILLDLLEMTLKEASTLSVFYSFFL